MAHENNQKPPTASERLDWHASQGFALVSDVVFQVLDDVATICPSEVVLSRFDSHSYNIPENVVGLHAVTYELSNGLPDALGVRSGGYKVSSKEYTSSPSDVHQAGIGELGFTWRFAPALAKAVIDEMVDKEFVTSDEACEWELPQWANMIGSGWFSKLAHSMAYTTNGVYKSFGSHISQYKHYALGDYMYQRKVTAHPEIPLFDIKEVVDPEDGLNCITAMPTKELRSSLRSKLTGEYSAGCPVARFSSRLATDFVESDPHAQNLLSTGRAEIIPERSDDTHTTIRLPWSPIDVSLAVLASKLDEYDELYGSPKYPTRRSL